MRKLWHQHSESSPLAEGRRVQKVSERGLYEIRVWRCGKVIGTTWSLAGNSQIHTISCGTADNLLSLASAKRHEDLHSKSEILLTTMP